MTAFTALSKEGSFGGGAGRVGCDGGGGVGTGTAGKDGGGSFGGGNAFQVNQSLNALQETVPWFADYRWVYGLIMTGLVGIVILGGIKRIATTAEKIVPAMCGLYVAACLYIMISMFGDVPAAVGTIVQDVAISKS